MPRAQNNSSLAKDSGQQVRLVTMTVDETNETNRFFSNSIVWNFQKNNSPGSIKLGRNAPTMRLGDTACLSTNTCEKYVKEERTLNRTTSSNSNSSDEKSSVKQ